MNIDGPKNLQSDSDGTILLQKDNVSEPNSLSQQEVETLRPTPIDKRTWNKWNIASLWVGMAVSIPTYMSGAMLVSSGMTWWGSILTVILGNLIVLVPLILNGHSGTKYGIPFPVFVRSMFGIQGSKVAAMVRAIIGCGWFGIQTWIGGDALYQMLLSTWSGFGNSWYLGDWLGLNLVQLFCFFAFWGVNMFVMYKGPESIKKLELLATPILITLGITLFIWIWVKVGSLGDILGASKTLITNQQPFWKIFFPGLTGIIGFWATLALNIMDFTRFTVTQRDQVLGQIIGLPPTTTFFATLGIFVTSATIIIYDKPIWNPVELVTTIHSPVVTFFGMIFILIVTLAGNVAANIVSPANDFSNLWPQKITFRIGGFITGIVGVLIFPWKLTQDSNSFMTRWLIASSGLLGSVTGVMICDYFILRKTVLDIEELYNSKGMYSFTNGWNLKAVGASLISIIPILPGFIANVSNDPDIFPQWMVELYDYAWFISFALSFGIYWLINYFSATKNYTRIQDTLPTGSV